MTYDVKDMYGMSGAKRSSAATAGSGGKDDAASESKEAGDSETSAPHPYVDAEAEAGEDCIICMSEPRTTAVLPCRHMCLCGDCAQMLRTKTTKCPICRGPVKQLVEIE